MRWLFGCFLILLPSLLWAEPLEVLSGEHAGFTRIVVATPEGANWSAQHVGNEVALRIEGPAEGFDTSHVFDRLNAGRIAEFTQTPDQLTIRLDCDCKVSAFTERGSYAVLDIAETDHVFPTPELAKTAPPSPPATSEAVPEPDAPLTESTGAAGTLPASASTQEAMLPHPLPELANAAQPLRRAPLSDAEQAFLDNVQQRLLRELGAATTQGILDPALKARATPDRAAKLDARMLAQTLPENRAEPPAPPAAQINDNMRILPSLDDPAAAALLQDDVSRGACPPTEYFEVENWGDDRPVHRQIAEARATLYGEFDRLSPDAAILSAKTYIYFGFGAEARQTLTLIPDWSSEVGTLAEMADVLEHGRTGEAAFLPGISGCAGGGGLWGVLAQETEARPTDVKVKSVLLALNRLPVHLRRIFAPELSRRFLAMGKPDAASFALRSLDRLPERRPTAAKLAQAQVDLNAGRGQDGQAELQDAIDDNDPAAPEALIALIQSRVAEDEPIAPDIVALVDAFTSEYRGTELGDALDRSLVLALSASGQFDRAAGLIAGFAKPEDNALRGKMLHYLTRDASDIVFLDHVLDLPPDKVAHLSMSDRRTLIDRLITLGFAAEARRHVAALKPGTTAADRILRARLALAEGNADLAAAELDGLQTDEAQHLLAKAKDMSGDHAGAADLYRQTEARGSADQSAWMSEDWRSLTAPDAPLFGPVSALPEAPDVRPDTPEGMLSRSQDLLRNSSHARETLTSLLSDPSLQMNLPDDP